MEESIQVVTLTDQNTPCYITLDNGENSIKYLLLTDRTVRITKSDGIIKSIFSVGGAIDGKVQHGTSRQYHINVDHTWLQIEHADPDIVNIDITIDYIKE